MTKMLEVSVTCVVVLFGASAHPALEAQEPEDVSVELRALFRTDQADRQHASPPSEEQWKEIQARDEERRARVYELLRADGLSEAEDFYHAAMILQHGPEAEDVLLAHILATTAAFRGDERGRWLSAAALDRYLHRTRRAQRFGTQYIRSGADDPFKIDSSRPWSQGPYIRWLPDSIREIHDVEPLADQEERVRTMNRPDPSGNDSDDIP